MTSPFPGGSGGWRPDDVSVTSRAGPGEGAGAGLLEFPVSSVFGTEMVVGAERAEVFDFGWAALCVVLRVVDLALGGGPLDPGKTQVVCCGHGRVVAGRWWADDGSRAKDG